MKVNCQASIRLTDVLSGSHQKRAHPQSATNGESGVFSLFAFGAHQVRTQWAPIEDIIYIDASLMNLYDFTIYLFVFPTRKFLRAEITQDQLHLLTESNRISIGTSYILS